LFVASADHTQPLRLPGGYDPRVIGVLLIVVAWYMNSRARSAYRQIVMQGKFAGSKVSELMSPDPATVAPWTRLDEIVSEHFLEKGERAVAVVRDDNQLVGLVAYSDVARVPRTDW